MDIPTEQMMGLVTLVAALLQVAKALPHAEKVRPWLPVISVGLGILFAVLTKIPEPWIPGIMVGLAASGGYSFMKNKNGKTNHK